ncbi:MAG: hypothetical protein KAI71_01910 [Candidatus Pacebacteria bacterium]|nr:hypothetical protein [Candidatus Paceibacterota bacterium]
MITVSYNIISLSEVRKINNNNNKGKCYFPIVIDLRIVRTIIHSKDQMNEILNSNIKKGNVKFVVRILRELEYGCVSKEIVNKAIANLTEPDQLEMAICLADRYNIKETKNV